MSEKNEWRKELDDNIKKYGFGPVTPDKNSGRGFDFDDKRIASFFDTEKKAIIFSFYVKDHATAEITLSIKTSFFLMRLISERLDELTKLVPDHE